MLQLILLLFSVLRELPQTAPVLVEKARATGDFNRAMPHILKHEGGYVNHPKDPGGATNQGVTQRTYSNWLRLNGKTNKSVRNITKAEIYAIYRSQYWDKVWGDRLPSGVAYAIFDFGVNSGPSRSVKFTQEIVGTKQDGIMGVNTLAAIQKYSPETLIKKLCDNRLAWLKGLSTWSTFGRGWERRVTEVKATALEFART